METGTIAITWVHVAAIGGALVTAIVVLWRISLGQATAAKNECETEKTNLITRLDKKDEKIEKLHQDAREIVTAAVLKSAEADLKVSEALEKLAENQKEFTETLRNVKCLHASGEFRAITGKGD